MDTDSEESFDEEKLTSKEVDTTIERRQLNRGRKTVKYKFGDESESDEEVEKEVEEKIQSDDESIEILSSEEEKEKTSKKRKAPEKKHQRL